MSYPHHTLELAIRTNDGHRIPVALDLDRIWTEGTSIRCHTYLVPQTIDRNSTLPESHVQNTPPEILGALGQQLVLINPIQTPPTVNLSATLKQWTSSLLEQKIIYPFGDPKLPIPYLGDGITLEPNAHNGKSNVYQASMPPDKSFLLRSVEPIIRSWGKTAEIRIHTPKGTGEDFYIRATAKDVITYAAGTILVAPAFQVANESISPLLAQVAQEEAVTMATHVLAAHANLETSTRNILGKIGNHEPITPKEKRQLETLWNSIGTENYASQTEEPDILRAHLREIIDKAVVTR